MPMKDSLIPDAWIAQTIAQNPVMRMQNGEYRTCPVRLGWVDQLFEAKKMEGSPGDPRFSTTVLWPPGGYEQFAALVWPDFLAMEKKEFPEKIGADGNPFGLNRDGFAQPCKDKQSYQGYTPGLMYTNMSSGKDTKPPIFDQFQDPIVDKSRCYAGVWAVIYFNLYPSGKKARGKNPTAQIGVRCGLRAIMIVQDDKQFTNVAAVDPKKAFSGVTINQHFDPSQAFHPNAAGAAPPGNIMPPGTPVVGGYAQPPGAVPPGYSAPPATPGYGAPGTAPGYGAPGTAPGYGSPPVDPLAALMGRR